MPYNIGAGAIIEVTMAGKLFAQQCLNVRHYRVRSVGTDPDGVVNMDAFASAFTAGGGVDEGMAAVQSISVEGRQVFAQWIYPARYRRKEYDPFQTEGDRGTLCETANISFSIQLAAEEADRHGVGRVSCYGVAVDDCVGGAPSTPITALLDTLGVRLVQPIVIGIGTIFDPVIYQRAQPAFSYIVRSAGTMRQIRTQRTRTLGRGI